MTKSNIFLKTNSRILPKIAEIIVDNEATIRTEEDLYIKFLTVVDEYELIKIQLTNIEAFDLSFCQLLLSIQKTVLLLKKNIMFDFEIPVGIVKIFENAGFDFKDLFTNLKIKLID